MEVRKEFILKIRPTCFENVKLIQNFLAYDNRGKFVKLFHEETFLKFGLRVDFKENYYSVSQKNVIRGMHFQLPPYEHAKLVHVIHGSIWDVVVDLRKNSPTYKKHIKVFLTDKEPTSLYIPEGFAHGFKALEDNTVTLYQVTSAYQKDADSGIAFDTIGFDWEVNNPIVSERDCNFISLQDFESPF